MRNQNSSRLVGELELKEAAVLRLKDIPDVCHRLGKFNLPSTRPRPKFSHLGSSARSCNPTVVRGEVHRSSFQLNSLTVAMSIVMRGNEKAASSLPM